MIKFTYINEILYFNQPLCVYCYTLEEIYMTVEF